MRNLSKECSIVPILSPAAAASADRSSAVIDTKGYAAFAVFVQFGSIATGAVTSFKLQHADAASNSTTLTSGADVAGSNQAVADDDDNQVFGSDVIEPTKRFYQLVVDKDAANNTIESAIAILYRNKSAVPSTHATGSGTSGGSGAVNALELLVHPVSGTA